MATRIGIGNIGSSFAQSQGWKLIQDYVNKDTQFGLFAKDGTPFYQKSSGETNSSSGNSITFGDKVIDAVSGFLDSAKKSLMPDTSVEAGVVNFNYTVSSEITNAPLEEGQFLSINQVNTPTQIQVNYATTGTEKQRQFFENAVKSVKLSYNLFIFHTGELTIPNVKITGYTVNRDPHSAQMYNVSINVQEIMTTPKRQGSLENSTVFSGAGQDIGELQANDATGSQVQSAKKAA